MRLPTSLMLKLSRKRKRPKVANFSQLPVQASDPPPSDTQAPRTKGTKRDPAQRLSMHLSNLSINFGYYIPIGLVPSKGKEY